MKISQDSNKSKTYLFRCFPRHVADKMTNHVFKNFPDQSENIRSLLLTDAIFEQMCADYEEICTWLAAQRRSKGASSEECDRARELVRDLETEIKNVLRDAEC